MRRANRPGLAEQIDFVVAHAKDLPGDIGGGIAAQRHAERADLVRVQPELLEPFGNGLGNERRRQIGVGPQQLRRR